MDLETLFTVELENAREVVRDKERQLEWLQSRPPGCVCDPRDWDDTPGAVCAGFINDPDYPEFCKECQHERECHGKGGGE